jgi:NAD(P)-dependent dehydrogenase (short-subunit alcohol dehydrogenase family)
MERNLLVIGGSSGVGLEIVRQLSSQGDHVFVASRGEGDLAGLPGVTWQSYDVTDREAKLALPEQLDGLVYCPGTIQLKPFGRLSDEDFQQELEVNFFGAVRVIRQAHPAMKAAPLASIVLFSTVAVGTGLPYHAGIASAKGALEGLARTLAAEFAPKIRVNSLALSLTDTPLAATLLSTEEKRRASAERHPLKRIGDAAEVAKAAAFLLGAESGFMTGQVLKIDGGLSSVKLL